MCPGVEIDKSSPQRKGETLYNARYTKQEWSTYVGPPLLLHTKSYIQIETTPRKVTPHKVSSTESHKQKQEIYSMDTKVNNRLKRNLSAFEPVQRRIR